jgi:hypothetical protein
LPRYYGSALVEEQQTTASVRNKSSTAKVSQFGI